MTCSNKAAVGIGRWIRTTDNDDIDDDDDEDHDFNYDMRQPICYK